MLTGARTAHLHARHRAGGVLLQCMPKTCEWEGSAVHVGPSSRHVGCQGWKARAMPGNVVHKEARAWFALPTKFSIAIALPHESRCSLYGVELGALGLRKVGALSVRLGIALRHLFYHANHAFSEVMVSILMLVLVLLQSCAASCWFYSAVAAALSFLARSRFPKQRVPEFP